MKTVVDIQNISKMYRMYDRPFHRLKELLSVSKNQKFHKEFWALKNITLSVTKGQTIGIIGQNGSGKSTLLQIITGVLEPTTGIVSKKGRISAILELGSGFNSEFSGLDNVYMNGSLMGFSKEEMKDRMPLIEDFAEIGEFIHQPVKTYSSGMYVRLAFAAAINVDPDILIIDEALAVGDAYFQAKCFKKIKEIQNQGKTILFVSHDAGAVKNLCQKAYLLDEGNLIESGKPDEVFDYYNAILAKKANKEVEIIKENKSEDDIGIQYRTGNQKLQIEKFWIEQNHKVRKVLVSGEETKFFIKSISKIEIDNPTIGIQIKDRIGNIIFGTNSFEIGVNTGHWQREQSKIFCFQGKLNLGRGEYTLTIAIHEGEVHIDNCYDWIDKALLFKVVIDNDYQFIGPARVELSLNIT